MLLLQSRPQIKTAYMSRGSGGGDAAQGLVEGSRRIQFNCARRQELGAAVRQALQLS